MISLFAASLLLLLLLANAADPDPLQDHCVADLDSEIQVNGFPCKPSENTTASDFKFSRLANRGNTNNELGLWITRASVEEFPGVNTMGLSSARADYAAKHGMNPPHVHPRASETFYLFEGDLMYVGFVDTDYKLYATYLTCGDLFVFPGGLCISSSMWAASLRLVQQPASGALACQSRPLRNRSPSLGRGAHEELLNLGGDAKDYERRDRRTV
ncbi:germin-like protein 1-1 [Selaginella moellendorffii]|uniref:germin-like protein 1-1 n=1 Tax=Selaginella moellendorffii TaxID=88036 RepID=UPI000D1CA8F7|nr:germin-like protein 1-1 [Selaginella moellendorffii]|eukprot:XP_024525446.1 germin-like protein 1-1 [Selaginella moellendorffii]